MARSALRWLVAIALVGAASASAVPSLKSAAPGLKSAAFGLKAAPDLSVGAPVEIVLPDYGAVVRAFVARPPAWNETLVNVGRGHGRGAPERRAGWLRKHWLLLDAVDRSSDTASNDFLHHRGIFRDWNGSNEYQETLHFREEGVRELLWDRGGLARDLEGRPVLHPRFNLSQKKWRARWDYDVYFANHAAPRWAAIVDRDWLTSPLFGDGLSQDNIGNAVDGVGSFGDLDARFFQHHLEQTGRLPGYRSRGLGIRGELKQGLVPRLQGVSENEAASIRRQDPVYSEYWRFRNLLQLYSFSRSYEAVKAVAARRGRSFDVHGNQDGFVIGYQPYKVLLSDFVDSIWFESSGFSERGLITRDLSNAWGPFRFEMAEAMAGPRKPILGLSKLEKRTPDLWANALAEVSAGGGALILNPEKDPEGSPERAVSDAFLVFRDEHRALFERAGRLRHAGVAVLYSLPTFLYDQASRDFNTKAMRDLGGVARALEEGHLSYDVLLVPDAEFRPDDLSLATLRRYEVLILPSVALVSRRHADLLRQFAAQGGTLIAVGDLGTRDARGQPRTPSLGAELRTAGELLEPLGDASFPRSRRPRTAAVEAQWRALADATRGALSRPVLSGMLPEKLWIKAWRHGDDLFSLHFVNYALDSVAGKVNPRPAFTARIRPPAELAVEEARWLVPGRPARSLDFKRAADVVEVQLPSVDAYGVLVLGPRGREAQESALRRGRRLLLRASFAGRERSDTASRVAAVEAILAKQGAPAFDAAAQALLESIARQNEREYVAFVEGVAQLGAAIRAFDFGNERATAGWTAVAPDDLYRSERGWGWLTSLDQSEPTPEERFEVTKKSHARDWNAIRVGRHAGWPHESALPLVLRKLLVSGRQQRFRVDVPDGRYRVRLVETSPGAAYKIRVVSGAVSVNGAPVLLDAGLEPGSVVERHFEADARDGHIELAFGAANGWAISLLAIEEAASGKGDAPIRGAIRDWQVSPRRPNPEWFPLDAVAPPSKAVLAAVANEGWVPVSAASKGLPVVSLGTPAQAEIGDVVYARAIVSKSEAGRARLAVGGTSAARVWLNGEAVLSLSNQKGILEAEVEAEVMLRAGRNVLVLELERFWERHWLFYATLAEANR